MLRYQGGVLHKRKFAQKGKVIVMAKKTGKEKEVISKSKEKREKRHKEVAKEKRAKLIHKVIGIVVLVVVVAAIVGFAGYQIYKNVNRTTSSSDFSAGLTSEGLIDGVDVLASLDLVDYENMVIPMDEVAATEEEVNADIQNTLESNQELKEDADLTIADGDKVSIDYVGTIDGVAFDGGDSNGAGYDLTIGSGSFVDDFEEQLIGHHPGEEMTVEVTFPDDYQSEDVAGKDASFAVTIHGIYVTPELTDEFVQANLSDQASTAEEYRTLIEDNYYQSHLKEYISNYIIENSNVTSYPKSFVKQVKSLLKYNDEYTVSYYNQMFASYGMGGYENPWDIRDGIDDEMAYEKELKERAQDSVKQAMVYQAIFEKAGLSIDMDAYYAKLAETSGDDTVTNMKETYGESYLAQTQITEAVMDYLMENANVQ